MKSGLSILPQNFENTFISIYWNVMANEAKSLSNTVDRKNILKLDKRDWIVFKENALQHDSDRLDFMKDLIFKYE